MQEKKSRRKHSETFKLSVLREYYSSGSSKNGIARKYSINPSCLYGWLKKYPIESECLSLSSATIEAYHKAKEQPEVTQTEALEKRIEDLRRSLELEKMRSRAFEKMIEIAEQEEGISILKKDGAKR